MKRISGKILFGVKYKKSSVKVIETYQKKYLIETKKYFLGFPVKVKQKEFIDLKEAEIEYERIKNQLYFNS